MAQQSPLTFVVRRREPEFVTPATPTPHEIKLLSDIDDQEALRFHIPTLLFYPKSNDPKMAGKDPAKVIREALAKALVFYYPLAGRVREGPNRKLMVECTGEGAIFIEADADVRLDDFRDEYLQPPFTFMDEILHSAPLAGGIINSPVLLMQVTRLACGGFILALRISHVVSDAQGVVQLLTAIAEIAQGAAAPSTLPVWQRELLLSKEPLQVKYPHHEYDQIPVDTKGTNVPPKDFVQQSFFFGPTEMSALRRHLSSNVKCSTFDLLAACIWRCRALSFLPEPDQAVRVLCIVNARGKLDPPLLPVGYYGNGFAFRGQGTTASKISTKSLDHAVQLVKRTKSDVTEEYMRDLANFLVLNGRPHFTIEGNYLISDVNRAGFEEVNFGWGKAIYGGPAEAGPFASYFIPLTKKNGVRGILVPMCLPAVAMENFAHELQGMLQQDTSKSYSTFIVSAL